MYCPRKDILHAWFYGASAIHVSQYWLWIYRFWITLTIKILVNAGLIEKNVVFKLLHIHPRGRSFRLIQLKLAAFCLPNKMELDQVDWSWLSSVIELTEKFEFDYVRLPKANQSNNTPTDWVRLSSIDYWFGFVRLTTPGIYLNNLITLQPVLNEIVQEWVTSGIE